MTARELKKWLARRGCVFEGKRGGSGHLIVVCQSSQWQAIGAANALAPRVGHRAGESDQKTIGP
jgi:hypothetical protein